MHMHQNYGDSRADIQMEDDTKGPEGSKAFPLFYSYNGSQSNEIVYHLKKIKLLYWYTYNSSPKLHFSSRIK